MAVLFANSGDPDQMPHLHSLPITLLGASRLQYELKTIQYPGIVDFWLAFFSQPKKYTKPHVVN